MGESTSKRRRSASIALSEHGGHDPWHGKSYYRQLHATWCPCSKERDLEDPHPSPPPYAPNFLDDPQLRANRKHRHRRSSKREPPPTLVSSLLQLVKPDGVKDELNSKFEKKHPWLQDSGLSLSKIRNLKKETLQSCQRLDLEVATGAIACLLFEKLVLAHYVNKANRKLYMSVCLLLAAKFNEPKGDVMMKTVIKKILADIDQVHSLSARLVLKAEFMVYAQLAFNLHVPIAEVQPHFTRLLKFMDSSPRQYLEPEVYDDYATQLALEEQAMRARDDSGAAAAVAALHAAEAETQDEAMDAEPLLSDEEDPRQARLDQESVASEPSVLASLAQWWHGGSNS